jgi:uncharacterized protein YktB (UPF0637 family)
MYLFINFSSFNLGIFNDYLFIYLLAYIVFDLFV